jgi:uncharacterized membrane protein
MDQRLPICKHRAARGGCGQEDEVVANRRILSGCGTLLLALLLALAGPARAGERSLPALFEVIGVSQGDVLIVRAAPDPSAQVVGTLAPDARGIEVVGLDPSGRWGQVNTGERSGWAAMRYLGRGPGAWEDGTLPEHLRCFGTEPFWSLEPGEAAARFATPDAPDRELALRAVLDTGIPGDPRRALIAEGEALRLTASIAPAACSDGMSDRAFGLSAAVVIEGAAAPWLLVGCCSIAP